MNPFPDDLKIWDNRSSLKLNETHRHEGIELHCCKSGKGFYRISGMQLPLRPGRVTLLWAPMTHQVFGTGRPFCRSIVQFPEAMLLNRMTAGQINPRDVLPNPAKPCIQFILNSENRSIFNTTFVNLYREFNERPPHALTAISLHIAYLLLVLSRSQKIHVIQTPNTTPHEERLAEQIEFFIDQHAYPFASAEELSVHFQLSPGHLRRIYKKVRRISLQDLLDGRRLEHAKRLLKEGLSVTETALACSFTDPSNFARFFRRHIGMSPSSYSRSHRHVAEDRAETN